MDMFTSYGHNKKPKLYHRFFDDFRPGLVPLRKISSDSSEDQCADTSIIPDTTVDPTVETPMRPQRARQTPTHLKDYVNE